ncbi:MAG: hypothetical protein U5L76_04540 [Patescibacteria group bacterium]|nr:hypothetical protein [Patescibacteria group bacterium]
MMENQEKNLPGGEFDEDGNLIERENIKKEAFEEEDQGGFLIEGERKIDQETGHIIHEHKVAYESEEDKKEGKIKWGNENDYSFDEKGRVVFSRKQGFSDQEKFKEEGEIDWGQEREYEYDDDSHKIIEQGNNLENDTAWKIETQLDNQGRKKLTIHETTSGPEKGRKLETKYSYEKGKIEHDGQEYEGMIRTEDGRVLEQGDDDTKKAKGETWQKIVVFDEEDNYLAHWRTKE